MGSVKKAVKKVTRPEVLLPLAVIGTGGAALGAFGPAAKAAMVGAPGAASIGSALHGTASMAPTAGILGSGGALSGLGKAALTGAGIGSLAMMGRQKPQETQRRGVDPQAQYNLMRLMNEKMGGAYTDEELNTLAAPSLSRLDGTYETIVGPKRKRRPMFEGLNYSGLTRLAAEGGSIKPKKRPKGIAEMLAAQEEIKQQMEQAAEDRKQKIEQMKEDRDNLISEGRQNIYDSYVDRYEMIQENPLYGPALPPMMTFEEFFTSPGANEEAMADQMFDMRRRERLNPMGRKDGGLMQMASAPDPMAERMDMMENLALDKFGKPLDRLSNDEVIQIEEMIDDMMPMAMGGSVPQTERIPNGMQIDGRGGGFIPMGARERKDDVPAMLAKNEFVMTADAVRGAGDGNVNVGAQRMYDLMNSLESKV